MIPRAFSIILISEDWAVNHGERTWSHNCESLVYFVRFFDTISFRNAQVDVLPIHAVVQRKKQHLYFQIIYKILRALFEICITQGIEWYCGLNDCYTTSTNKFWNKTWCFACIKPVVIETVEYVPTDSFLNKYKIVPEVWPSKYVMTGPLYASN